LPQLFICHVTTALARKLISFYAPQLYRQVLLRRVLAMGILSVRPSVTTRWYTKPRWDRDSKSSPYDSRESLVSNEVIWCRWVRRFPSNEGIKEGYPPLEIVILPLLAHLAWKRLQIDADLLRIIATTADELSSGTNIDDLEWPWTPKIGVFSEFLAILDCNTHLNCAETVQDRPGQPAYEMFGIKRRFQRCKAWPPSFKESFVRAHRIWVPPWKRAISATVD